MNLLISSIFSHSLCSGFIILLSAGEGQKEEEKNHIIISYNHIFYTSLY